MNLPDHKIEIEQSHAVEFRLDERYHPGIGHVVAAKGWHACAVCRGGGVETRYSVTVALDRKSTETTAREFAHAEWATKYVRNNE